jgi:hypothetical protein
VVPCYAGVAGGVGGVGSRRAGEQGQRQGLACAGRDPSWRLLTVGYRIKVRLDLQADKSSIVVKGPFLP